MLEMVDFYRNPYMQAVQNLWSGGGGGSKDLINKLFKDSLVYLFIILEYLFLHFVYFFFVFGFYIF